MPKYYELCSVLYDSPVLKFRLTANMRWSVIYSTDSVQQFSFNYDLFVPHTLLFSGSMREEILFANCFRS